MAIELSTFSGLLANVITDLKKVVSRKRALKFSVCVATTAWRGSVPVGELRNYSQYDFQISGLYFWIV